MEDRGRRLLRLAVRTDELRHAMPGHETSIARFCSLFIATTRWSCLVLALAVAAGSHGCGVHRARGHQRPPAGAGAAAGGERDAADPVGGRWVGASRVGLPAPAK